MSNLVIQCNEINKSFTTNSGDNLTILNGINLCVEKNQTVSIIGSSGSGKTSLLQILAGLDTPTSGEVIICQQKLNQLNDNQLCYLRNQKMGFIYQFHHLLPEFNALENVLIPTIINNSKNKQTIEYAKYILNKLNLGERMLHYPNQLSGGERQRVAIARATINKPEIIFADEPTGNLDNYTACQVLEMFFELQQELQTSLIIVTHDMEISKRTQQQYQLHNRKLSAIE